MNKKQKSILVIWAITTMLMGLTVADDMTSNYGRSGEAIITVWVAFTLAAAAIFFVVATSKNKDGNSN